MKKLSFQEFHTRMVEISKARRIFMPHITNNITTAFEIYQELLAQEEMEIFINGDRGFTTAAEKITPINDYERPRCPDDGEEMRFNINVSDMNGKIWPTGWQCFKCGNEYYSEKSVNDWMRELKRG